MNKDISCLEDDTSIRQDVVYGQKSGMALTFDLLQPKNRNGAAVLFFNSGGFYSPVFVRQDATIAGSRWMLLQATLGDKIFALGLQFSFARLLSNGFTVFDIRHGSSPKFTLDDIAEDSRHAVKFIKFNAKEYDIDPNRIGVWGMSAGGYLAALVGTSLSERRKEKDTFEQESSRVNAVVAYFPTGFDWAKEVELAESLPALKIDPAVLDSLSLKHHVSIHSSPTLIIYGEDDSDFIVEPSEALHSEMQKQGVESKLIAIPETGHLFLGKDAGFNVRAGEYAMFELVLWFQMYLVKK